MGGSQASFVVEDEMLDANVTETYMGEWKNDKRCGFGISERSDGLKYEGEWFNNRKYGYGVTTFKDGTREEGKYKNKHLFLIRSAKFRERIDSAVNAAQRASKIALQKADIAISRTATARGKAEQADYAAVCAREDSSEARACAQTFAPEFQQPGAFVQQEPEMKMDLRNSIAAAPPVKPQLDKLQITGAGHAGPGPPSPRGGMGATGGPGPPTPAYNLAPEKPVANHVGPAGSVINKSPVPNPGLDVRTHNPSTVPRVNATPTPSPKPVVPTPSPQPPPQAKPVPTRAPPKALSPQLVSEPPKQNNNVSDIQRFPEPAPPPVNKMGAAPTLTAPAPRTEAPNPQFPDPSVLRQPNTLQVSEQAAARGRTPTRQERSRLSAQNDIAGPPPAGGYNFQKIMDDRYRANPILYIFNPHIRDWFSRQQLMLVVLFVNVTLAIMFFKLLT